MKPYYIRRFEVTDKERMLQLIREHGREKVSEALKKLQEKVQGHSN